MRRRRTLIDRAELVSRLGGYLDSNYYPRLGLLLVVTLSGLGGFLASAGLLFAGWRSMPLRYGLAVVVAYLLFLLLVRLWVRYYRYLHPRDVGGDLGDLGLAPGDAAPDADVPFSFGGGGQFSGGGAERSFTVEVGGDPSPGVGGDVVELAAGALDADEGVVFLIPVALFGALVVGSVSTLLVIAGAPALLGEVLLDAGIAGIIYQRFHTYETRHWLGGVLRRTWKPMLALGITLVLVAALAQHMVPGADSVGDFFRGE